MRRSNNTLLGRVHAKVALEGQRDVQALYALIDPVVRARRELERADEPDRTLSSIRDLVRTLHSAEIEEVEILDAHKVSPDQGGRPSAMVRTLVRYNDDTVAAESRTRWVQDEDVWYCSVSDDD